MSTASFSSFPLKAIFVEISEVWSHYKIRISNCGISSTKPDMVVITLKLYHLQTNMADTGNQKQSCSAGFEVSPLCSAEFSGPPLCAHPQESWNISWFCLCDSERTRRFNKPSLLWEEAALCWCWVLNYLWWIWEHTNSQAVHSSTKMYSVDINSGKTPCRLISALHLWIFYFPIIHNGSQVAIIVK